MTEATREADIARASSAILMSLLKTLVDKEALSRAEVRALLGRAASELGPFEHVAPAKGAVGVVLNDLLPQFAEDGGD